MLLGQVETARQSALLPGAAKTRCILSDYNRLAGRNCYAPLKLLLLF